MTGLSFLPVSAPLAAGGVSVVSAGGASVGATARRRSMGSHQRGYRGATDVWLTPPEIIAALGPFDTDPCAAVGQPWRTAREQYTVDDDGLSREWHGLTWVNPPFGPEAAKWLARLSKHGNGVALVPARTETRWFVRCVWEAADAVLFMHGRPHFHHVDGTRGRLNSGAPICLIAYGPAAVERLRLSRLPGSLVDGWRNRPEGGDGRARVGVEVTPK